MKKTICKLLVATTLFSMTGFSIFANEINENKAITRGAVQTNIIPDNGRTYSYRDGTAYASDNGNDRYTFGKGLLNHYFGVYVKDANGVTKASGNANNGRAGSCSAYIRGDHTHTCSGSLMQ